MEDWPLRGEFLWQSNPPPPRGWAPADSKSLSLELEALAQHTELKEALGDEEPADVISRGGGVGGVRSGTHPLLPGPITRGQVIQ